MATYYGYTNRDQDKSVIDWAGITKTISDDLIATDQSRKAERFELQKTQDEELRKLDEFTQGADKTANQAAMQAAQGYRDFLMENHKLMKNGLMSVNDSKLVKSNAKATWATLNTAFKGHQDAYQAKIDAGGDGNLLLAEQMSKIFDFENKKIVPLPDGTAVFVKVDPKTGKIDMDTAQTPTAIMNMQMQEWPTIDVQKSASEVAQTAAIWKKAPNSTTTVENIRENPEFAAWKKNSTSAALDSDRRIASVLMDYLNYETTEDKDLASGDPRMVLMVKDKNGIPQPEFSEGQKGKAEEAYGSALEIALGYKETSQYVAPRTPSAAQTGRENRASTLYNLSTRLAQGDDAAFGQITGSEVSTLDKETGKKKTIVLGEPIFTENEIVFVDESGDVFKKIKRTGDPNVDALEISMVIRSGDSADDVQALFDEGMSINKGKPSALRGQLLEQQETEDFIESMPINEDDAEKFLKENIGKGFTTSIAFAPGKDVIKIKHDATGEEQDFATNDKVGISNFLKKHGMSKTAIKRTPSEGGGTSKWNKKK